jgi:hypothetical protein
MQSDDILSKFTFSFLESGHRQRILWVLKIRRLFAISVPICITFFFGGQPTALLILNQLIEHVSMYNRFDNKEGMQLSF